MALIPKNKSGFTLVEVILVVVIVALLGTIAVNMYFNSTKSFSFFLNYKSIRSNMRQARSFAMSNVAALENESGKIKVPDRYGVYINESDDSYWIVLFADNGKGTPFDFDEGVDHSIAGKDYTIYKKNYELTVSAKKELDSDIELLDMPVQFFYETGSGDFSAYYDGISAAGTFDKVPKRSDNYIDILLQDLSNPSLKRHLVINQLSGLSEEYITTTE